MAIGIRSLRDPYRPGTGPVIAPWIRPQRHNLLTFRRYWPWVSLATICLLLLLATLPLQNRWRDLGVMLLIVAG